MQKLARTWEPALGRVGRRLSIAAARTKTLAADRLGSWRRPASVREDPLFGPRDHWPDWSGGSAALVHSYLLLATFPFLGWLFFRRVLPPCQGRIAWLVRRLVLDPDLLLTLLTQATLVAHLAMLWAALLLSSGEELGGHLERWAGRWRERLGNWRRLLLPPREERWHRHQFLARDRWSRSLVAERRPSKSQTWVRFPPGSATTAADQLDGGAAAPGLGLALRDRLLGLLSRAGHRWPFWRTGLRLTLLYLLLARLLLLGVLGPFALLELDFRLRLWLYALLAFLCAFFVWACFELALALCYGLLRLGLGLLSRLNRALGPLPGHLFNLVVAAALQLLGIHGFVPYLLLGLALQLRSESLLWGVLLALALRSSLQLLLRPFAPDEFPGLGANFQTFRLRYLSHADPEELDLFLGQGNQPGRQLDRELAALQGTEVRVAQPLRHYLAPRWVLLAPLAVASPLRVDRYLRLRAGRPDFALAYVRVGRRFIRDSFPCLPLRDLALLAYLSAHVLPALLGITWILGQIFG